MLSWKLNADDDMARTRPENAQRKYLQSCLKLDVTRKKEARTTKDNMAKDSNGRATRYAYDMGLSWGEAQAAAKDRTLWRNIVVALCPSGYEDV